MKKVKLNYKQIEQVKKSCSKILDKFEKEPMYLKGGLIFNSGEDPELKKIYVYYNQNLSFFEFGNIFHKKDIYDFEDKLPIFEFNKNNFYYEVKYKKFIQDYFLFLFEIKNLQNLNYT